MYYIVLTLLLVFSCTASHAVVLQKETHPAIKHVVVKKSKRNKVVYRKSRAIKKTIVRKKSAKKITHKKYAVKKIRHVQKSHSVKKQPVKMVTRIGYNKIEGFHKISALPEQSSFTGKPFLPAFFASTVKDKLVKHVKKTVHGLNYTNYKLGGRHYDTEKGVYIIDCSIYVDNVLQDVFPVGFNSLVNSTGAALPTSLNYYNFFSNLTDKNQYWNRIEQVTNLQAGDILVFRNKRYRRNTAAGHVMIVMDAPKKSGSSYLLRVADAAPYRHSRDTRAARHSGIGIGTLVLRVDRESGLPTAYAWSIGSRWKSNVRFVMARPVNA